MFYQTMLSQLLRVKKLALVLDIDLTLLHATGDRRVQALVNNKDLVAVRLHRDHSEHFLKLRPHLTKV